MDVYIDVESLIREISKRLLPNFSKIVPGLAEVVLTQPEHLSTSAQACSLEFTKLDDFCPKNLEKSEWVCLKQTFTILAKNDALSVECFEEALANCQLNLPGMLIVMTWLASGKKPSNMAQRIGKLSESFEDSKRYVFDRVFVDFFFSKK